jgi:hypothetical protein
MTEITEDDVVECQIDDNADFASLYDSDTNTIDAAEALAGEITFAGITTLGFDTTYYARFRYTRGAQTSDWSNTVSKTMDAEPVSSTTWNPADKDPGITLSGGDLIATAVSAGGYQAVRAVQSRAIATAASWTATVTYVNGGSETGIGITYAAADITNWRPARDDALGVMVQTGTWGWELWRAGSMVTNNYGEPGASSDVWTIEMSGGNVQFKRNGVNKGAAQSIPAGTGDLFPFVVMTDGSSVAGGFTGW